MHGEYGSQRAVVTLRRYLKYLKEAGVELPFDWRDIEVPKVPEKEKISLDEKSFKKLVKSIPIDNICSLRARALFETLFATGMRISEALSLNKTDINWKSKEIIVKGKGRDERTVYLNNRSIYWLKRYLKARETKDKKTCEAFFANQADTDRMKKATARNYFRAHRKEWGGDEKIIHHTFRRSLATYLIEKGADLKSAQYLMGHKSERTTLRYYVMVNRKRAKKIHQRLLNRI